MRDSLANAKGELSNALALRKLTGEATRLLRIYKRQNRFSCSLEAETVDAGCAFPPADDPNILERLRDANNASDDALLYQLVESEAKEFTVTDWRDLTFARGDICGLWPEHSQAIAYREARKHPWPEPPQVDTAVLEKLKGLRPSLDAILRTLAQGGDLAERFRAVHWLCDQARDGRVTIYGKPAQSRLHPTNPLEATGPSAAIDPGAFNDDALTLSACNPPVANAFGASEYAARFAECMNAADAVKWCGVTVDRLELQALLRAPGESAVEAPNQRQTNEYNSQKRIDAKRLVSECFPQGVPPQDRLTSAELARQVQASQDYKGLEKEKRAPPAATILRVAGRRR